MKMEIKMVSRIREEDKWYDVKSRNPEDLKKILKIVTRPKAVAETLHNKKISSKGYYETFVIITVNTLNHNYIMTAEISKLRLRVMYAIDHVAVYYRGKKAIKWFAEDLENTTAIKAVQKTIKAVAKLVDVTKISVRREHSPVKIIEEFKKAKEGATSGLDPPKILST